MKLLNIHWLKHFMVIISLFGLIPLLLSNEVAANKNDTLMDDWHIVSNEKLDNLRAGFVLSNGVIIDISFDKKIFINGVEQSSSYFQTPENISLVKMEN